MRPLCLSLFLALPLACGGEGGPARPAAEPVTPEEAVVPLPARSQVAATTTDWPQWRGPKRDNKSLETDLLNEWPTEGPKLLWSARDVNKGKNVGNGYASIAIAHDRIYTLGDRDKNLQMVALDLKTGKVLWGTTIAPRYGSGGPRSTPTVDGNRVYGLTPQGILACADATSGKLLWTKDLKKDYQGHMMSGWNYSESPTIDGEKLVITPGGKEAAVVALNKETGALIWKCAVPQDSGAGYASIVIAQASGHRQYITLLGPELGLIGVDADTGKFLWNYRKVGNGTANIPTALVDGDLVFTSTGYNAGAALLKLVPEGTGVKAQEQYFLKGNKLQNHHGGMVLVDGHVYGGHGHNDGLPFCLEMKTGKMKWGPERGAGSGSAAIVWADGHCYFRWDNNVVGLVQTTPKGYHLKSEFQLPRGTSTPGWQHPVIHQGKLYLRGDDQLLCYDIRER
jgi:outer membrane protein assembly factor BamB